MPIITSESIEDTSRWCRVLLAQLTEDPTVFQPESESAGVTAMSGFTAALSLVKKGNKTPEGTATAMLGAVPGLGTKRVTALLAEKSIAEIAAMDSSAISALVIGGKKIGEKLATTIAEALCAKAPV
jgi:hypothetical protein